MRVDPKLIHRLFYPQVPAVLSAQHRGRVSAMPVVSYLSVSTRPPVVAVGCDPASFTLRLASTGRAFSLSLLDRSHLKAVERLASTSGRGVQDKLAEAGIAYTAGRKVEAPVIEGAEATLECTLHSRRRVGDHVLLFGLVKTCYAKRTFAEFWDFTRYEPILYTGWRDGMSTYPGG